MSRILTCPVPDNISPLSPNGFLFSIQRLPELTYFCQEATLPSVSLGTADIATPFVKYPLPGEHLDFSDLTVQFLVDAEMKNYKAVFNWLNGLGFPESYDQYTGENTSDKRVFNADMSDATLSILNNANVPVQTIQFQDCIPTSLSSLVLTSTSQDVNYLFGEVTFKYTLYKLL